MPNNEFIQVFYYNKLILTSEFCKNNNNNNKQIWYDQIIMILFHWKYETIAQPSYSSFKKKVWIKQSKYNELLKCWLTYINFAHYTSLVQ